MILNKKNPPSSDISKRLREFAKYASITQRELGKALYVSANQISNIFNNRSNLTEAQIDILKFKYNLNPNWLRYGEESMFLEKPKSEISLIPVIADIPAGSWEYWYDSYSPSANDEYIPAIDVQRRIISGMIGRLECSGQGRIPEPIVDEAAPAVFNIALYHRLAAGYIIGIFIHYDDVPVRAAG